MRFPGQTVVDIIILVLASTYGVIGAVHIMQLWQMRGNFFIVLRSPLLACVCGLCITLRFTCSVYILILERRPYAHSINIIIFPALWIAQAALVLTAVRLLVMYYPSKRAKYGRYTNEKHLVRVLGYTYVLLEVLGWSSAAALGKQRAPSAVVSLSPVPASFTIMAVIFFGFQLKEVHDLSNMGRDIRIVGAVMLVSFPLYVAIRLGFRPDSLEKKYGTIAFLVLSHTPTVWILNIRPAREILRQNPGRVLMLPFRRRSRKPSRVAITVGVEKSAARRSRGSYEESSRLLGIMAFEPLREAFGDFCHKSLCGESFLFLVDVSDFKNNVLLEAESDERARVFKGYGGYLAIVNDYINDGSHSEVNIDSRTKRDILEYTTFDLYSSLNLNERKEVFSAAEKEISNVLMDNLLNKFILSRQYKAVVDLG